jgi:outer membrane protein TolC
MSLASALLGLATAAAYAQQDVLAYLPAESAVRAAIIDSPGLQAARSRKEALAQRAQAIQAGSAEVSWRSSFQRRRLPATQEQFGEFTLGLERPLRLWGKSAMDASVATQTEAFAEVEYADALHEASRELIKLWFSHRRALSDHQNAADSLALADSLRQAAAARLKQGELSQLDASLAQAEWQRAQATLALAQAQSQAAAATLARRYPGLTQVAAGPLPSLPDISDTLEALRPMFMDKNHELRMLRLDAERQRLAAERLALDRRPDPTVGVFVARDRGGAEQIAGVSLSIAFPGAGRIAQARAALAEAQTASDKVRAIEPQLSAGFEATYLQFRHKRLAAEQLRAAAEQQNLAESKSRRAFGLGEQTLSELLQIARTASAWRHDAELMHLDAAELSALIRLDLHQIWDFDEAVTPQ